MLVKRKVSVENVLVRQLLDQVDGMTMCEGVSDGRYQDVTCSTAYRFVSTKISGGKPVQQSRLRSKACEGACSSSDCESRCKFCNDLIPILEQSLANEKVRLHPKTPLSTVSRKDLIKEVKATRVDTRTLQAQVNSMRRELDRKGVMVPQDVSEGLASVIDQSSSTSSELMKLFWAEQKKAFSVSPHGMRWHPMMIRFAIYLQYQSPRAYQALKETGVLRLPNKSTLRDYTNVIQPREGFQPHVFEVYFCSTRVIVILIHIQLRHEIDFQELKGLAKDLPATKRFVALLHDEMSIKADLVYDHRGGEVVGFINPDRWTFQEVNTYKSY